MIEANKQLFWDVDLNKIDIKKYPKFIIKRILEYGDEAVVKWEDVEKYFIDLAGKR